jgi:hypothetical protein
MRILLTTVFTAALFAGLVYSHSAQAQTSNLAQGIEQAQTAVNEIGNIGNSVGGVVSEINALTSGSGATTTTTGTGEAGMFNPNVLFPAWGEGGQVTGVIGSNDGALNQGEGRLIIYFIPKIVELLIWLVAPIVTIMFLYSGITFVYAGDREEEVKKARDFFRFAVIGLTFIVLSYSIMKAVFFIIV